MPIKTLPWDTADHLKTPADIVAYLEAVLDEGADDPAFLVEAIGTAARAHGMSQLAADTGITRRGLYKALGENGNPCCEHSAFASGPRPIQSRPSSAAGAPRRASRRAARETQRAPALARLERGSGVPIGDAIARAAVT
jgi:probable addiction module antidote protein